MPKVSIIVPVYNGEKFLCRCIDSILVQTFEDFEVIMVNDGSTDSSGTILDDYAKKDKRVRVIHKENQGVSATRNAGLREAKGKYIMFVDCDDWVKPNMLSEMLPLIESEYDLIFSEIKMLSKDGETLFQMEEKEFSPKELVEAYIKSEFPTINFCGPMAKLFHREMIEKNHLEFDTNLSLGEDMKFNFQYLTFCKRIKALDQSYYNYIRENEESLFTKVRESTFDNTKEVSKFVLSVAGLLGCGEEILVTHKRNFVCDSVWLVKKAVYSSEKKICYKMMSDMSKEPFFLDSITHIKGKKYFYVMARLIKYKMFFLLYYGSKIIGNVKKLRKLRRIFK